MASNPIYEFHAQLRDYQPKIWRRFQVVNNTTMARLGYILMTLFEMQANHLFRIEVPFKENLIESTRKRLGDSEYNELFAAAEPFNDVDENRIFEIITDDTYLYRDEDEKVYDITEHKLKHIITAPGSRLVFVYDFGDNWIVDVTLERVFKDDDLPGRLLPRVLEGEGYGITEDCGGVEGLEKLARAFKKKKGEEYNAYREWLGLDDLDLERFDINDINFRLLRVPRIYANIYEYDLEPSERSMDILERRYLLNK